MVFLFFLFVIYINLVFSKYLYIHKHNIFLLFGPFIIWEEGEDMMAGKTMHSRKHVFYEVVLAVFVVVLMLTQSIIGVVSTNLSGYYSSISVDRTDIGKKIVVPLGSPPESNGGVSVVEAKSLLDLGHVFLLDVRDPGLYHRGHIVGAVSFPVSEVGCDSCLQKTLMQHRNDTLLVYGDDDSISRRICDVFVKKGFDRVYYLVGGFDAWRNRGLPVSVPSDDDMVFARINQSLDDGKPVFLFFYVPWCGYCKKEMPIVRDLEEVYGDYIVFLYVDVEEHPVLSHFFGVYSFPTMFLITDRKHMGGYVYRVFRGLTGGEKLSSSFDQILGYSEELCFLDDDKKLEDDEEEDLSNIGNISGMGNGSRGVKTRDEVSKQPEFSPHRIDPTQPVDLVVKEDVSLYNGNLFLTYPLKGLPGRAGMDVGLSLKYMGHGRSNCYRPDKNGNSLLEYPYYGCQMVPGPLGEGWSYHYGFIYRDAKETADIGDDEYYVVMPSGEREKLVLVERYLDYDLFDTNITHLWRIKAYKSLDGTSVDYRSWLIVDSSGKKYFFEHERMMIYQDLFHQGQSYFDYGKKLDYRWDLTRIEDVFGNQVEIEYEDLVYPLDSGIASRYELYGEEALGTWPYTSGFGYLGGQSGTYYTVWSDIKRIYNGVGHYYKFYYRDVEQNMVVPSLDHAILTSSSYRDDRNLPCGGYHDVGAGNPIPDSYTYDYPVSNHLENYTGNWVCSGIEVEGDDGALWYGFKLESSQFVWSLSSGLDDPVVSTIKTYFPPEELEDGYYSFEIKYHISGFSGCENSFVRISIATQRYAGNTNEPPYTGVFYGDEITHVASVVHNHSNAPGQSQSLFLTFYLDKTLYPDGLWLMIEADQIFSGYSLCGFPLTIYVDDINFERLTPRILDKIVVDTVPYWTQASENNLVYKFEYNESFEVPIDNDGLDGLTRKIHVLTSITPIKHGKFLARDDVVVAELPSTRFSYYTMSDGWRKKTGLLRKIRYSTGGTTVYDYEYFHINAN
ncbi:MAG: hypothetical protein DRN05_06040, partial [Thermoplasmata archaeon]